MQDACALLLKIRRTVRMALLSIVTALQLRGEFLEAVGLRAMHASLQIYHMPFCSGTTLASFPVASPALRLRMQNASISFCVS